MQGCVWVIVMHKTSLRVKAFSGVYSYGTVLSALQKEKVDSCVCFYAVFLCLEITRSPWILLQSI